MAIQGIGQAGVGGIGAATAPQKSFGKALKAQVAAPAMKPETEPLKAVPPPTDRAVAGTQRVGGAAALKNIEPTKLVDQVAAAQKRMDAVLELAQSGKSFSPAELLSLQTQMYRASQELDLAGKVIEKATGGVKQILQTQV